MGELIEEGYIYLTHFDQPRLDGYIFLGLDRFDAPRKRRCLKPDDLDSTGRRCGKRAGKGQPAEPKQEVKPKKQKPSDDLDFDLELDLDLDESDLDLKPADSRPKSSAKTGGHDLFGNKNFASPQDVSKALGVSTAEAYQMTKSIDQYSRGKYIEMRAAERGDMPMTPDVKKQLDAINSYLDKAPKYEGSIYRGLSFGTEAERDAFLSKIQDSGGWTSNSMDSWSSNQDISQGFAGRKGVKPFGIVLSVKNQSGASIKQLSNIPTEDEVLVGKGVNYAVKGSPKRGLSHGGNFGDYVLIEVEDRGMRNG